MTAVTAGKTQGTFESKSLWHLLGLKTSLSFRVTLIFILPGSLSPFFIDRLEYGGSLPLWLGLIALAHSGFTITLLSLSKIVHRSETPKSRPFATLVAFLGAQTVRGSILGFSTVYLGFTDDPKLPYRIISGGVFIATVLSVIAISVAIYDQHADLVSELEDTSKNLVKLRTSIDTRLQEAIKNLRDYTQRIVLPGIAQIDELLQELKVGGNKFEALIQMQTYVENELRPFSHQIAHDRLVLDIESPSNQRKRSFKLPETFSLAISMRPVLTTLLFFITYAAAAQRTMTFLEALPFNVVSTILLIGYFSFFKKIFSNREFSLASGLILGILVFAGAGAGSVILYFESFLNLQIPQQISIATVFIGLIYGSANLGFTLLTEQRARLIVELTKTIQELEETIELLRQREWVARRRISYVMHGSLQSSLNAAIMRLGASEKPSPELIDQIRTDIAEAMEVIWLDESVSNSFSKAQQDISHVWEGTIEIVWNLTESLRNRLDGNPVAAECLIEVIREAISNAARHGKANRIEIAISLEKSRICLEVLDNGQSQSTGKTPGLGSELLDELCSNWSLQPQSIGGMKLRAELVMESQIEGTQNSFHLFENRVNPALMV